MKKITKQEMIEKINGIKGSTFVSVDVESEPSMRKTNNPYIGAIKNVTLSGVINYDYEKSVNSQLKREGEKANFVAMPRAWGVREDNWITHKGAYYLSIKVQGSSEPVYTFNGATLDESTLKPFMPVAKKPHTQSLIDEEIVARDVKLDNIRCIRIAGEEFQVV